MANGTTNFFMRGMNILPRFQGQHLMLNGNYFCRNKCQVLWIFFKFPYFTTHKSYFIFKIISLLCRLLFLQLFIADNDGWVLLCYRPCNDHIRSLALSISKGITCCHHVSFDITLLPPNINWQQFSDIQPRMCCSPSWSHQWIHCTLAYSLCYSWAVWFLSIYCTHYSLDVLYPQTTTALFSFL